MSDQSFRFNTSLVIVANEFPDRDYREKLAEVHDGSYFREIYMRWRDLFSIVPEAKNVKWHEKIDFEDEELFYRMMRLVVESDATPLDLYADIVVMTDGLTIRWSEFLNMVPEAADVDWEKVADRHTLPDDIDDAKEFGVDDDQ